jgi:hypothetical protein
MMSPLQNGHSFYRYNDLVDRGIVRNRMTLSRWQKRHGFPRPVSLGPNTRGWIILEVQQWLEARANARQPPSPANDQGRTDVNSAAERMPVPVKAG